MIGDIWLQTAQLGFAFAIKGTFKPNAQKVASECNTKGQDNMAVSDTPGTRAGLYKIIIWDSMESNYPSFQMGACTCLLIPSTSMQ